MEFPNYDDMKYFIQRRKKWIFIRDLLLDFDLNPTLAKASFYYYYDSLYRADLFRSESYHEKGSNQGHYSYRDKKQIAVG